MKEITLKEIRLVNFKGVRNLAINFNQKLTSIYGRNASGKTTIFDAFTWLLFGKNSEDKTKFGIKTIDDNGEIIPRIPHEVTAIISVSGLDIMLTRRLKEKWQKKRGSAIEEFKGNEEERLYNDVPMSVKDWQEKINDICSEDVFKMITNPLYFTSMNWQKQREMLIQMAGDVSDDDVVAKNQKAFGDLIDSLNGKTMDEYKREIGAKKKRVKEEIDTLPSRIEERRMSMSEVYDWSLLQSRLHHKEEKLKELDEQISDKSKLASAVTDKAVEKASLKASVEMDIVRRRSAIINSIRYEEMQRVNEYNQLVSEMQMCESRMKSSSEVEESEESKIYNLKKQRETLLGEWKAVRARVLEFDENTFVCPTCGRQLEVDQIEQKREEMENRFNQQKSADLEENKRRGLKVKEDIEFHQHQMQMATNLREQAKSRYDELVALTKVKPVVMTDEGLEDAVNADEEIKQLNSKLASFSEVSEVASENEFSLELGELKANRDRIREEIAQIREQLAMKTISEQNIERIKQLEESLRNANEELARLEGIEFTIAEFTKTRISMLELRINSMFKFVSFRLFEQQINGGEVETCKAMVCGVPFEDLNNAKRINGGIDIINAICNAMDMTAPIVIDNAEAVNELLSTKSQLIRLVVSEDDKLKIA